MIIVQIIHHPVRHPLEGFLNIVVSVPVDPAAQIEGLQAESLRLVAGELQLVIVYLFDYTNLYLSIV